MSRARTLNTGPGSRSLTLAESAELARRERESRRPMTPAERIKVRWFFIGALFATSTYALVALWVVAAGTPP